MRGHLGKQLVVEGQPGFVRLGVITVREDTRPGDRYPQTVEAHLSEQRDILRVTMVKIDRHIFNTAVARNALHDVAEYPLRLHVGGG